MTHLARFDKHIDNGGVSVSIDHTDDGLRQPIITMYTTYLDYPAVSSSLHGYGHLTADDLEAIGRTFLEAATKYREADTTRDETGS